MGFEVDVEGALMGSEEQPMRDGGSLSVFRISSGMDTLTLYANTETADAFKALAAAPAGSVVRVRLGLRTEGFKLKARTLAISVKPVAVAAGAARS